MTGDVAHFRVERIRDRVIIAALRPFVARAIAANYGSRPGGIAEAAYLSLDPDGASPPLVREGCRATLGQIARDMLAGGAR